MRGGPGGGGGSLRRGGREAQTGDQGLIPTLTCFSNTSICTSGSEKFLLKSRPHSPTATHS